MPAIDTGGAKTGGPRVRVKAKAKATVTPTPDQADRNTKPRTPPTPVKVRMYAHPGRKEPQKVITKMVSDEDTAKAKRAETKAVVHSIHVTPVPSPDATDSTRSPAQQAHDRAFTQQSGQRVHLRAQGKAHRGAGVRLVVHVVGKGEQAATDVLSHIPQTAQEKRVEKQARSRPGGGNPMFAVITSRVAANTPGFKELASAGPAGTKLVGNAASDAAEIGVTTPSSVAKLVSTAVHHPKKVPGMLVEPYKQLAKDPAHFAYDRPLTTAMMLDPVAKMPGRILGKAARLTGKQTLERPAASLPGTALKELQTGSRDFFVRKWQEHQDRANSAPTVTVKDVQHRVDAHAEHQRQLAQRAEAEAVRDAKKSTKGQPKDVRAEAVRQARETAREHSHADAEQAFAEEFGANARPSTGHVEKSLARTVREHAFERLGAARHAVAATNKAHEVAFAAARAARAKARSSPKLASLETMRRDAQGALARAQRQHQQARVSLGVAKGRAEVLSRNVGGKAGGYGVRLGQQAVDDAAAAVRDARARVSDFDQKIAAERQRISGVPPAQHQALVTAIHDRAAAQAALTVARAEHATARADHIAVKRQPVALVSPSAVGRTFAHKQDAARVADHLNNQAEQIGRGGVAPVRYVVHDPQAPGLPAAVERAPATVPVEFTVREVGDGRWAAIPKVANERMHPTGGPDAPLSHAAVGSSKSTVAKTLRTTRGLFTNAVLPLSPKWLGGQAAEAGVRAIVSGAGPLDIIRFNKTVKALNDHTPGAGDALATRMTGANSTLISGAARDFANGKSLAEEFRGTPLAQPAAAATKIGRTAPAQAVRTGWRHYTTFTMDRVNGTIENAARRAMAGQAIKTHGPLMETRLNGLSDRAIQDAANGLRSTEAQVQLGRAVDRMYGKYNGFTPEMRSLILHWTPFLPWTLNAVTFLTKVLPVDHPVLTSLLAATSVATEDWRKENRLSLRQKGHLPVYMLGSYPDGKGGYRAIGRYTPAGITDPAESVASLVLPQASAPLQNLRGISWTGDRLKRPGYGGAEFTTPERIVRALTSAVEAQVPGAAQAGRLSGLTPKYVDKKNEIPPLKNRLLKELPGYPMKSPTIPTSGGSSSSGRVKVPGVTGRVKVPGVTGRVKVP